MLAQFCPEVSEGSRQTQMLSCRKHPYKPQNPLQYVVCHDCVHRAEGGRTLYSHIHMLIFFFFFFYNKCCCLAMKSSPVCSCSNWLGSQAANWGPQSNRTHACPVFNHATWLGCSCKLAILPGQLLAGKWNCGCPELFFLPCPLPLDAAKPFSMVVFHCRHMFHKECLPVPSMVSGWLGHHLLESSWCSQRDVLKMITILLGHPLVQSYNLHLCLTVTVCHIRKSYEPIFQM